MFPLLQVFTEGRKREELSGVETTHIHNMRLLVCFFLAPRASSGLKRATKDRGVCVDSGQAPNKQHNMKHFALHPVNK